jgi:predicted enzyme related to lactoylglutathione lyase
MPGDNEMPRLHNGFNAAGSCSVVSGLLRQLTPDIGWRYIMLQRAPMYAYLPARDMARARRFYEDKLGLKAKHEVNGGVVYEFGKGTACFMYPTPNAGTSKASQAFWTVDDIAREVAELKARGVQFEHYDMPETKREGDIHTGGGARAAWFRDSEGNILAIIQDE